VLLVEAKAHIGEMKSTCQAEAPSSLERIRQSLAGARSGLGVTSDADWSSPYYQYANRLAHLWFLRKHGVQARLAFVYFVGDVEMRGPKTRAEWRVAIDAAHGFLGLNRTPLNVAEVFIDVAIAPGWLRPDMISPDVA
jgi:hypothetical protein